MSDSIATRVARGAALLDRTLSGWDERIDLERLDLGSPCNCVLGQEFADHPDVLAGDCSGFDIGYDALAELHDGSAETSHGFTARWTPDAVAEFAALTAEWTRVILARRGGAS